jgi:hypothetical protein
MNVLTGFVPMYIPVDSRYLSTASFEVGAFCIENVIKRLNIDILKYKDRSILIKQQTFPVLPDGTYIFIPRVPIWEYFGRNWNGKCWYTYF